MMTDEVDKTEHIFNFVDVLSFVLLFSSSPNESLYFVKVTEKGAASENHSDSHGHFIFASEKFLKRFYWSRNVLLIKKWSSWFNQEMLANKYQLLPAKMVFSPDEVFDIYVEFSEDKHIDTNTYNIMIQKSYI